MSVHSPIAVLTFLVIALLPWGLFAQQRIDLPPSRTPIYRARRVDGPLTLNGKLDEPAWRLAPAMGSFHFPWWKKGAKKQTIAKMLWDDRYLYIGHICEDEHITARYTKHDDPVAKDDCFEVMIAPNPKTPDRYYNIEWNVLGAYIDGHRKNGPKKPSVPWVAEGIRIAGVYAGTLNQDADKDRRWSCEVAIPFKNFARYMKHTPPRQGDRWRLNLNRHGGDVNMQYSQWSPGDTERPAFHTPHRFGEVIFIEQASDRNVKGSAFHVELKAIHRGYDRKTCWVHARAGMIPASAPGAGNPFSAVLTMHSLRLSGSDVYYPIHDLRSDDGGAAWTAKPTPHDNAFARRRLPGGVEEGISDFWPTWHEKSGVLLGTGHTVRYIDDNLAPHPRPRDTVYSVYDAQAQKWSRFTRLVTPDTELFFMDAAGSTQRVDLPSGDILLPTYSALRDTARGRFTAQGIAFVMRCSFDGKTLKYLEHGDTLTIAEGRGFSEPSLVRFNGLYLMALRNDAHNYITTGKDGLHFEKPQRLRFDDGKELGSYNTQTHWLTLAGRLYLVYTRRGADNNHILRHRGPLFLAQFDPQRLCVLRNTERVIVPERGARLGNFGVTRISDHQSWVTVTEWMQSKAPHAHDPTVCERYGADNSVFVAKITSAKRGNPRE